MIGVSIPCIQIPWRYEYFAGFNGFIYRSVTLDRQSFNPGNIKCNVYPAFQPVPFVFIVTCSIGAGNSRLISEFQFRTGAAIGPKCRPVWFATHQGSENTYRRNSGKISHFLPAGNIKGDRNAFGDFAVYIGSEIVLVVFSSTVFVIAILGSGAYGKQVPEIV